MENFEFTISQDGRFQTANDLAVNFFGLDKDLLSKWTIFDFIHPDDRTNSKEEFEAWNKKKKSEFSFENRQIGINGEVLDVHWKFTLNPSISDSQGEIICEGLNITKSKQAARLDTFTQFTLNQVKTAIFWCNSDGTFFYVNPTACEWLQYSYDELMSMHVADINPEFPKEAWWDHWMDIKTNGLVHMESFHMRKNGEKYPVELYSNYVQFEGEEYKLSFVNDISEKRKIDEELKKHREHLEHLVLEKTKDLDEAIEELRLKNEKLNSMNEIISEQNEELKATLLNLKETQTQLLQAEKMASLGVLTAGVAHEINNPLNYLMGAYLGFDNFFTDVAPHYKDEVEILLKGMKSGIDRAAEIVNGLNQFSRDSKEFDEDCDVHAIIENCLAMLHNQYKQEISIHKDYTDGNAVKKGNVGKLHQVFINLLTNAIQSIDGKGDIYIKTWWEDKKFINVEIRDTGRGIKAEDIEKIADPFYTTKSPGEGTGLGLYLTYKIIQEHKGEISFDSEVGVGTIVSIRLPL